MERVEKSAENNTESRENSSMNLNSISQDRGAVESMKKAQGANNTANDLPNLSIDQGQAGNNGITAEVSGGKPDGGKIPNQDGGKKDWFKGDDNGSSDGKKVPKDGGKKDFDKFDGKSEKDFDKSDIGGKGDKFDNDKGGKGDKFDNDKGGKGDKFDNDKCEKGEEGEEGEDNYRDKKDAIANLKDKMGGDEKKLPGKDGDYDMRQIKKEKAAAMEEHGTKKSDGDDIARLKKEKATAMDEHSPFGKPLLKKY